MAGSRLASRYVRQLLALRAIFDSFANLFLLFTTFSNRKWFMLKLLGDQEVNESAPVYFGRKGGMIVAITIFWT